MTAGAQAGLGAPRSLVQQVEVALRRRDYEGALHLAERALTAERGPDSSRLYSVVQRARGKLPQALAVLDQAVLDAGHVPELHLERALVLNGLKRPADAIQACERAIQLRPRFPLAWYVLGQAAERLKDDARAEQAYRTALSQAATYGAPLLDLGNLLHRTDRFEAAEQAYRRSLLLNPGAAGPMINLGALRRKMGQIAGAEQVYRRGLTIEPRSGGLLYNFGNLLRSNGRPDEAIALFRTAIEVEPENASYHWNLSLALLVAGDIAEGFREYEWRWRYADFPSKRRDFKQPQWDGGPLAGRTLLVHSEQGLGDTFQFLRYLPMLGKLDGPLVLEVHEPLIDFLKHRPEPAALVPRFGPLPHFDLQIPMLSLPVAFRSGMATLPAEVPYLEVPPGVVAPLPEAAPDRLNVGVVWAGNPKHSNDRNRSMPVERLLPLAERPELRLFSLQKGPAEDQAARIPGMIPLSARLETFGHTAAILQQLDLVITVDTSMAHLAGALARPVWVLLPYDPDWRWLFERADSPWYPTARLFRQPRPGDWDTVIRQVGEAAAALAAERRR